MRLCPQRFGKEHRIPLDRVSEFFPETAQAKSISSLHRFLFMLHGKVTNLANATLSCIFNFKIYCKDQLWLLTNPMYKRQFTICYFKCSQENLLPFKVRAPKFSLILHCWCMSLFLNHLRDLDNHLFQRDRNKTYLLRLLYVYIKKKKKTFIPTEAGHFLSETFTQSTFY